MKFRKLENMDEEKKKKLMNFLCVDHLPLTAKDIAFYAFLFFLVVIFPTWFVLCWSLCSNFDNMPIWIQFWQ